jgi:hypothetical protein
LSICFLATLPKEEKILKNHEVEEYAFLKMSDLKELKLTPHTKKRIMLSTKIKNL